MVIGCDVFLSSNRCRNHVHLYTQCDRGQTVQEELPDPGGLGPHPPGSNQRQLLRLQAEHGDQGLFHKEG